MDPINQNGIIIGYEILFEPLETFSGQIRSEVVNTAEQAIDLLSLEAFVNYNISVRANTSIGVGPYSSPVTVLTMQDSK